MPYQYDRRTAHISDREWAVMPQAERKEHISKTLLELGSDIIDLRRIFAADFSDSERRELQNIFRALHAMANR
jgi:hypothetical protein